MLTGLFAFLRASRIELICVFQYRVTLSVFLQETKGQFLLFQAQEFPPSEGNTTRRTGFLKFFRHTFQLTIFVVFITVFVSNL